MLFADNIQIVCIANVALVCSVLPNVAGHCTGLADGG